MKLKRFQLLFPDEAGSCCVVQAVWEDSGSAQDKNGKWSKWWPELFQEEASRCSSQARISPLRKTIWSGAKSKPALNILDPIGPEGNLTMDPRTRYITELSAENNGGKKPRESLLLLVTWRTHSHLQQRAEREVQMECFQERIWFDCSEQKCFCFMRCESRIVRKSLNCRKSRSVMTRWKEKEVRTRRGMWGRRQQEKGRLRSEEGPKNGWKSGRESGVLVGGFDSCRRPFVFCLSVLLHSFPVTCCFYSNNDVEIIISEEED